jgi:hypothetical protein
MKTRNLVLIAIATIFCSCNNSEKAKQEVISNYSQGLVEFSKISSIVSGVSNVGRPSINVDSIAKTIDPKDTYEHNLLKINEMQFTIANELSFAWVNMSMDKYLHTDDAVVSLSNTNDKDSTAFRRAIVQNLIDARSTLEECYDQEELDLRSLTELSFATLKAFNTFCFCFYFVTDNTDYLTFFSSSSEKLDAFSSVADSIFTCSELTEKDAFEMAATLEAAAFINTMNTLSFNILWSKNSDKMQEMADFFNKYSEMTRMSFFESAFKEPIFNKKEYIEFLKQSTDYKVELMEMVVNSLRQSFQQK